jgi:hypothetical protein
MAIFYKGVLRSLLNDNFRPGTVTKDFKEALRWAERIKGSVKKGPSRHISHGKSCVIEIIFDERKLHHHDEFQKSGVSEHDRKNCWTSIAHVKAQINSKVEYRVLTDEEVWDMFTLNTSQSCLF